MGRQHGESQRRAVARQGKDASNGIAAQMRELRAVVDQQQAQIVAQQEQILALQAQAASVSPQGLTRQLYAEATTRRSRQRTGGSSRRALLKGAGAAAAAATVALVASQQNANAAPAGDGDNLILGAAASNIASSTTTLTSSGDFTSYPYLVTLDASSTIGATALLAQGPGGGVYGVANGQPGATGVTGYGTGAAYGVVGQSDSLSDIFAGGTGRLRLLTQGSAGAPTSGNGLQGEMLLDANTDLWVCTDNGTPGTWYKALHTLAGFTGGVTNYLSKPIRLLDTRGSDPNALHNGGGMISSGPPYTLVIAGVNWMSVLVPSGAVGAIGKLTVISGAGGSGFVSLVPSGSGTPATGTLPYGASQILATAFNVGLGGSPGAIDIYVGGTSVDVVIDLFAVVA